MWVSHQTFSDAYYEDKDKKEKEMTAAAKAPPATTVTPLANDKSVKTPFDYLWTKEKGECGGKSGTFFR